MKLKATAFCISFLQCSVLLNFVIVESSTVRTTAFIELLARERSRLKDTTLPLTQSIMWYCPEILRRPKTTRSWQAQPPRSTQSKEHVFGRPFPPGWQAVQTVARRMNTRRPMHLFLMIHVPDGSGRREPRGYDQNKNKLNTAALKWEQKKHLVRGKLGQERRIVLAIVRMMRNWRSANHYPHSCAVSITSQCCLTLFFVSALLDEYEGFTKTILMRLFQSSMMKRETATCVSIASVIEDGV